MDKINKLSLPVTILIASIILGSFYYLSEVNRQKSFERQQQLELKVKTEQINKNEFGLQTCLDEADVKYKKSAQYWLNLENKIGVDNVLASVENEKKVYQQDKDECYKRYK